MKKITDLVPGVALCALIAVPCWILGQVFPIIGSAVFGILFGMVIAIFWKSTNRKATSLGIAFSSKKILQYAIILLGFGLNLNQIAQVGALSLPIIVSTIATALIVAAIANKFLKMPSKTATLIGVGSSICGGSAIAATAPVINAKDDQIAQSISVIFLFNILAALIFPSLGMALGMTDQGFAIFAGTAINDTSSVTAAAATWDGINPGANTLDMATIIKLTRTLAIIPITLVLGFLIARQENQGTFGNFSLKKCFPMFIVFFVLASLVTTIAIWAGVSPEEFSPFKIVSKFFIVMAMIAIGLNTDIVKLVKSGGKPILLGLICWISITLVSLGMQVLLGLY